MVKQFINEIQKKNKTAEIKLIFTNNWKDIDYIKRVKSLYKKGFYFFIGPYDSKQTQLSLYSLKNKYAYFLSLFSTDTRLYYYSDNFFSLVFSNKKQAKRIREFLFKQKRFKRLTIIYSKKDQYANNLVFWLDRYLDSYPIIEKNKIDYEHLLINKNMFWNNLMTKKHYILFISSNHQDYQVLFYYLKYYKKKIKCNFLFPDSFHGITNKLKKTVNLREKLYWFTYFNKKSYQKSWIKKYFIKNTPHDLYYIYLGIKIALQSYQKALKAPMNLVDILERSDFIIDRTVHKFSHHHFRITPVHTYFLNKKGNLILK